ncbi:hypothetical protein GIB67_024604 [Kingdonia uniflora]|uniref:Uncharacterized protein n=1 Tax=Kingdonia uniflora TaxID=39325 RepID=A0A7J7LNY6_9MAGN|nr:hypothetical protein GIB67_024595 [Kingdonia uniflora]KAF6144369.1 hypothetical protein GIB67_024596 [Kingdonia uniflora]KAF6144376.1 hypothetical protein GIB67_024603 [Kingdonia uniflora]KAF6144377.1 hypothetical protein GIB67_024604 [Kingdonia uniflora]
MSNQQSLQAGEMKGQAQEKTSEWIDSAKDTANTAQHKTCEASQSAKESGQHGQEQASGFLQQTGEKVMDMASGAADSVKSTLGVGDHAHKK